MFPRHINNYLAHGESHNTNESVLTLQTPSIQNDGWELEANYESNFTTQDIYDPFVVDIFWKFICTQYIYLRHKRQANLCIESQMFHSSICLADKNNI